MSKITGTVGNGYKTSSARTARIKCWVKQEDKDLDAMWDECEKRGYTDMLAERRDTLLEYVKENIDKGNRVAPLLKSIESATYADYFAFDVTSYSDNEAIPIESKKKLAEVLI
jgi:hypothetical protein